MSENETTKKKPGTHRDWREELVSCARCFDDLPGDLRARLDRAGFEEAAKRFGFAVTSYYLSLANLEDPQDPILRMCLPDGQELARRGWTSDDPIKEDEHAVMRGLVRRYPDRALLLMRGDCPVYCRHCTRRAMGTGKIAPLDGDNFYKAIDYLRDNPEIRDVIVSGGEPLLMEDHEIAEVLEAIRGVNSVEIIRLASRAPVTLPSRITRDLVKVIAGVGPVFLNTQFNHPRELTGQAARALALLADAGIPVSNQSVLLRGVNDRATIIEDLCRGLLRNRVRPYYLFMCDLVAGTGHFRVPLERGIEIMSHLRGKLSGMGIPQLVVDLPGGVGKIPIGPQYVVEKVPGATLLRSPDGQIVEYPDPD